MFIKNTSKITKLEEGRKVFAVDTKYGIAQRYELTKLTKLSKSLVVTEGGTECVYAWPDEYGGRRVLIPTACLFASRESAKRAYSKQRKRHVADYMEGRADVKTLRPFMSNSKTAEGVILCAESYRDINGDEGGSWEKMDSRINDIYGAYELII